MQTGRRGLVVVGLFEAELVDYFVYLVGAADNKIDDGHT